jgi:cobalt-zinc-cadmium efflux system protein
MTAAAARPQRPHAQHHGVVVARLRLALLAVVAVLAAEVLVGWRSGSLALLGDAGHLATDGATLGLAWFAVSRARRRPTARHTYGFLRTGILVAALNGAALLAVAGVVAAEATSRLGAPHSVAAGPVVAVAAFALLVNGGVGLLLHGAGEELSVRSAALHVLSDAIGSAGVLVSGLLILAAGWTVADPIVSLLIAALIAAGALGLLREALHILSEATPRDLDSEAVRRLIAATAGIEDVHDLHIWSLDRRHRALSAHVTVPNVALAEVTATLRDVETRLCQEFGIEHATLQPECPSCAVDVDPFCDVDSRHRRVHAGGGVDEDSRHSA